MALATAAIFQGFDQNILQGATISASVSPMALYPLEVLGYLRPDMRVRWSTKTVTITFTLGSSQLGDILVIPISNFANTGSPSVVRVTNAAGLDVNIPTPDVLRNGIPKTLVVDLSLLDPNATHRTSATWHLVITGNPYNVNLGGAVAIYGPKTALADRDFQWRYTVRKQGGSIESDNPYLTLNLLNLETMRRSIDLSTLATDSDADALEGWFDGCNGRALPGLLWLTPEIQDAYLGVWQPTFERVVGSEQVPDTNVIRVSFTELAKGLPLKNVA